MGEVARWLGIDGQAAKRKEALHVDTIEVRFVEEAGGREDAITEVTGADLEDSNSLDAVVQIIESAATRDALTRYGTCCYCLYFHLKGGQKNRGRYPFWVPGGAHTIQGARGGGGSAALARRGGYGAQEMDNPAAIEALKATEALLRWSTDERRSNDERSHLLFQMMEKVIKQQNEIIQMHNDQQVKIMELSNQLDERKYELDLRKKSDEQKDQWMGTAIEAAKTYGPLLLPPVIETLRKFNNGPNYVSNESEIFRKVQEAQARAAAAAAAEAEASGGGGGAGNGNANGATTAAADGEPTQMQIANGQIAFTLVRLVGLLKMTGSDKTIRGALAGNADLVEIFDAMMIAGAAKDAMEKIDELVQMSIAFGMTLKQHPMLAMGIVQSVEGFVRAALIEFSQQLQAYEKFVSGMASEPEKK